jgi:phage tail sheath protein FI
VAGIYARSDARFGIHKAPANEIVEGTLKLQHAVGEFDQAGLNAAGFNAIRSVPGRGIRVMGARTLSRSTAWQYVPVVRLFVALTRWLNGQMGQIVFEPHTPDLRQQVQRRIASHCAEMMQAGMLASDDPDEAYFVKCDAELNPPESVEAGRLVVHIGLAPSVPAEFVEVRITHDASGIAVTGT